MKALVILATICSFVGMTAYTSSIRAEETWKEIKEGPNKGSYKGELWGLDALASVEDYNDQRFVKVTVNQQHPSEKAAVETCKQVGNKARNVISGYGPFNVSAEFNNTSFLGIGVGPFDIKPPMKLKFRTPCAISIVNKANPKISARLSVEDKSTTLSMQLTLPIETQ